MAGKRRWTEKEVTFLKENYGKQTVSKLSTELNRSMISVREKAATLGLSYFKLKKRPIAKNSTKMNQNIKEQGREFFGLFLKNTRKKQNLNQTQVAEITGLSTMTISNIESGKCNFGIDIFYKLSIALNFNIQLILKDNIEENAKFDLVQKDTSSTKVTP